MLFQTLKAGDLDGRFEVLRLAGRPYRKGIYLLIPLPYLLLVNNESAFAALP